MLCKRKWTLQVAPQRESQRSCEKKEAKIESLEAALTRAIEASAALAAATEKENATKDGTMDKQDAMDYEMMQAEHTATLKRLQANTEQPLAEAAEEKEKSSCA